MYTAKRKRICYYGTAALILLTAVLVYLTVSRIQRPDRLTVSFLHVGQGDAIFVETPTGTQALIDGGPGRRVLRELGAVMPISDRSVDMLVGTHADKDHIGGLTHVLDRFHINTILASPLAGSQAHISALKERIHKEGAAWIRPHHNQVYHLGGGVKLQVLFPDRRLQSSTDNADSTVMRLVYEETSVLLTGDMPNALEQYLHTTGKQRLAADILKVAHHGSDTSSGREFLHAVAPEISIIQAGEDNAYGHPDPTIEERLLSVSNRVLCTCTHGRVTFTSDGKNFTRIR